MPTNNYRHGLRYHPGYSKWNQIKQRCFNKSFPYYHRYGGRGIGMYDKWIDDPAEFINYISALPMSFSPGYSLDRKDNNGDYEPGNLRWATKHIQSVNQRTKSTNKSGFTGVWKNGNKFRAEIIVHGIRYGFGSFETIEEAVNARNKFIIENELTEYIIQPIDS